MGQGWSQEYSAADIYNNGGNTTSDGLGPRIRADSEPPTSLHYGGTKLAGNIPEDEELQTTPTNLAQFPSPIASADWKRVYTESGFLKEKPNELMKQSQLSAYLETKAAASSKLSNSSSSEQIELLNPPKPRDRSNSYGGYSHFSDFSLFPDKFGPSQIKRRHPSNGSNRSEDDKSVPCTPPSTPNIITPLQSVKDTFFRSRALSYDPDRDTSTQHVVKSPSLALGETQENKTDTEIHEPIRPRASSYGGGRNYKRQKGVHADRQPFADYTLFPDKDPKFTTNVYDPNQDKAKSIEEKAQIKVIEFPSKKGTLSTVSGQPPTVIITPDNINYVNSAVLIASALTIEANKQSRYNDTPKIISNEERNYNNNNTGKPPRFNFFDYSMIPDKDPRAFVPNNKQKKQNDAIFGKDQN